MILIYVENKDSGLSKLFGEQAYKIPFVDKTVLEMSYQFWQVALNKYAEEITVYCPELWDVDGHTYYDYFELIKNNPDTLIIITDPLSLPEEGIDDDIIQNAKANPGILFDNVIYSAGTNISVKSTGGIRTSSLNRDNYLETSIGYIENTEGHNVSDAVVYGKPVILGSVDDKSTICGPCYIDEHSDIRNCTIYPGSIILGSKVMDSTIFTSVVNSSLVSDSNIKESLIINSVVIKADVKSSTLPSGAKLSGRKV